MGDGIYVKGLRAWFGETLVLKGVDLTVAPNAVTALGATVRSTPFRTSVSPNQARRSLT